MEVRALECSQPGRLIVAVRPTPKPGPGEVLIRIRRAGVCGTDLHIFEGSHPFLSYPRVIGHELSGEVAEAPAGSAWAVGDRVCVIPYLSCGRCVACRKGKTNCCQTISVLGVHIDGGMAEYVCVPEGNLISADDVSLDEAAMVEFLAIGAHAVSRAAPSRKDRVLVVGAGPIGIGCAIFSGLSGASVTVADPRRDRLDFCVARLGVDHIVEPGADVRETMSKLTSGDFYDVVVDATGNVRAMMAGLDYVAHGGAYVLVSVVRDTIAFEDPEFHKRETSLLASRNATRKDFKTVMSAMAAGDVPTEALLTHRAGLEESAGLFPHWIAPETGVIKAMIEI
jgi:2-desacetyl-2-hydroxyethyl bacteriochlorophyllide A dehydrogenase